MIKNKTIRKGLVAVILAAQIGMVGCNNKGGAWLNQRQVRFRSGNNCTTVYYMPNKGISINDYGCDKTIDEIVVREDGEMRIYVNKDTKKQYPVAERFRQKWYEGEIKEVDNKGINQLAEEIGYK